MKRFCIILSAVMAACVGAGCVAPAQTPVPPPAPEVQLQTPEQLDQLLGPIALYPDPLIAEILPAATLPSELVLADRYLDSGGDPNASEEQGWDPSVAALTRYPTVLKWMDENLAWTTAVGQAFLYQQQDVMDSIQRLRAQAQALGNLQSTPQETVVDDDGAIDILPANPQVIYVPVYQPQVVYYQRSYGAPFISFGAGFALGSWLDRDFDWHGHHLMVWRHDERRPPDWWSRRPKERARLEQHANVWQPRNRGNPGFREGDRGWGSAPPRSTVTAIGGATRPRERQEAPRPEQRSPAQRPPVQRPAPAPAQHAAPAAPARPASGALIGVGSARETREFSNRGQTSRQAFSPRPSAAPARPAPPARSESPRPSPGGSKR